MKYIHSLFRDIFIHFLEFVNYLLPTIIYNHKLWWCASFTQTILQGMYHQ